MLYLLAILLPPLAVLIAGKPVQAVLNVLLTLLFYVPGLIHALFVVNNYYADKRTNRVVKEMRKQTEEIRRQAEITAEQAREASEETKREAGIR
jgi:uncharacterized membrane protein YqaE (UPF0057 family)